MISYHPKSAYAPIGRTFTAGFMAADTHGDLSRIAKGMSLYAWSPIIWKDGYRRIENFISADYAALDFETHEMTLAQALKTFCDMQHVIGTTRNHQVAKNDVILDRFRVLLRFQARITSADKYRYTMEKLAAQYPIDSQCLDPARHFFACKEIVSVMPEGESLEDLGSLPANYKKTLAPEEYRQLIQVKTRLGRLPQWLKDFLVLGKCKENTRNHRCWRAAIELLEHGYSAQETIAALRKAPFDRHDFDEAEIVTTTNSAVKTLKRRLKT